MGKHLATRTPLDWPTSSSAWSANGLALPPAVDCNLLSGYGETDLK